MEFSVAKRLHFSYGHRLIHYEGKCSRLHGHNGMVEIHVSTHELDGRGMVWDFSEIKRSLQAFINEKLDHRMVLHREDPLVDLLRAEGEDLFLMDVNPTAENLARLLFEAARDRGLPVVQVVFWETPESCAVYRESRANEDNSHPPAP